MKQLLKISKLSKHFGGLAALSNLDMDVREGEILGLIGPNGAGKTTLFNAISGFFPPSSGTILFDNKEITGLTADRISGLGLSRTFQATTLFMEISVLDNVFTGYHLSYRTSIWKRWLRTSSAVKEEKRLRQEALQILEFMGLEAFSAELAANLPHGHQRILGVCLALATHPRLLLLDEPMTGMNPVETEKMIGLVRQVRDRGVTAVLVEHDMKAVMNLCDRIVVLNYGQKIAEGLPEEIRENKTVIEAYLGAEGAK
jgi:branched-chain amino acid transport system ATP-binding protein